MNNLLLIADSGSTKTDWCVVRDGISDRRITTKGMNPYLQTSEEMEVEIREHLLPHLPDGQWRAVYFYGAGCTTQKCAVVADCLQRCLPVTGPVEVHSDLLGAARCLCGHRSGIAGILGTGSNSCFYDGQKIIQNTPALGFILGDEGSGAYLGKCLVSDILKHQLAPELAKRFLKQFVLTQESIIERVYRAPFPNRFLASLNVFLEQNRADPAVHRLLIDAFQAFLRRNIMLYDYANHPLNCIGTIAHIYQPELTEAATELGIRIGTICKTPMDGLLEYHCRERGDE